MSDDQQDGGEQPQTHEELTLFNTKEVTDREALLVFARRDLVTQEGKPDLVGIGDMLFDDVKAAVADVPGDRAKVGLTPTHVMEKYFPEVPGPSDWAGYDDVEALFHETVYDKVKGFAWRTLSTDPDGIVQSRLSANGGAVLSQTKKTKGREVSAYVTRNRKCLDEDLFTPIERKRRAAADKAAAVTEMMVGRLPEHGKWFDGQFRTHTKEIAAAANNRVRAALNGETSDVDDTNVADDE